MYVPLIKLAFYPVLDFNLARRGEVVVFKFELVGAKGVVVKN